MLRHLPVIGSDKLRFLIAGASTTAFSYLLYAAMLPWVAPKIAYAVSYVVGIVWSYTVNSVWVFGGRWTWKGLASYPLVYLVQALLSFFLFSFLLQHAQVHPLVAPLVTLVLMLPVTYLLGRAIVRRTSPGSADTPADEKNQ
jgi:putative flippase GtrA